MKKTKEKKETKEKTTPIILYVYKSPPPAHPLLLGSVDCIPQRTTRAPIYDRGPLLVSQQKRKTKGRRRRRREKKLCCPISDYLKIARAALTLKGGGALLCKITTVQIVVVPI